MSDLPVFDFHAHGGDPGRTEEIAGHIRSEELTGLVLLSLPLNGMPDRPEDPPHLNDAVLRTKARLNADPAVTAPVYAFGALDDLVLTAWGPDEAAAQVAGLADIGCDGLKLWEGKPDLAAALGGIPETSGTSGILPDDPRLIAACREAGRRGLPVIFHVADPPSFWRETGGPWSYVGRSVPSFDDLIAGAARLCAAVPGTTIVFPHLLFLAEDLPRAARFLGEAPNACLDLSPGNYFYAPLSENPEEARSFLGEYRERILFGTDGFWFGLPGDDRGMAPASAPALPGDTAEGNRQRHRRLLAFLSGDGPVDNPFPLTREETPEVSGLALPRDVLEPILAGNARRLLPDRPRDVPETADGTG